LSVRTSLNDHLRRANDPCNHILVWPCRRHSASYSAFSRLSARTSLSSRLGLAGFFLGTRLAANIWNCTHSLTNRAHRHSDSSMREIRGDDLKELLRHALARRWVLRGDAEGRSRLHDGQRYLRRCRSLPSAPLSQ
jgi:hypothetical protein